MKMMSNSDKLQACIATATDDEKAKVIAVPWDLIHFVGDTKKGVLLAQLIYLSDRGKRKDGYIYKTYDEMTEATGLSEDQIRAYYKEFEQLGIFEKKIIKANAFPTVHFKLDFGKIQESFQEFLRNRYSNNSVNDTGETQESLTKNTNIDTSINTNILNTLSHTIKGEENFDNEISTTNNNDYSNEEVDFTDVLINAGFCQETAVPLPANFEPSLENQFWTVTSFPEKSVSLMTESFIDFYDHKPTITKTLASWQMEWRKWVRQERGLYGYSEDKLEVEQKRITAKVRSLIHQFALDCGNSFLRRDNFYSIFSCEEFQFSKETIDTCLEDFKSRQMMFGFFNYYIYTPNKIKKTSEGELYADSGQIYYDWSVTNGSLSGFICENNPVSREEIQKQFRNYCQKSIDAFLNSGVTCGGLAYEDGQYWDGDSYPGWQFPAEDFPVYEEMAASETGASLLNV